MINNSLYQVEEPKKAHGFFKKEVGDISVSITKNWTEQAVRCYLRECNCIDCAIAKGNYSFMCQMSNVVKILLEQIGPPEESKVNKLPA